MSNYTLPESRWTNGREQTIVDIQLGGPGNNWAPVVVQHSMAAPSGGGQSFTTRYGQTNSGSSRALGTNIDDDPGRFDFDVMVAITKDSLLDDILKDVHQYCRRSCDYGFPSFRVRNDCDRLDVITNYEESYVYNDGGVTSKGFSQDLKIGPSPDGSGSVKVMRQLTISAATEDRIVKLRHINNEANSAPQSINAVWFGCDNEVFVVTDENASNTCEIGYSNDGGATFTFTEINTLATTADVASDVIEFGDYILVASPQSGVEYALKSDVVSGATTPWSTATVAGATWATNFPNGLVVVNPNLVLAFGNGGRLWKSETGRDFKLLSTGSANNLTCAARIDSDRAWIGGASGTLLLYDRDVVSSVTVTNVSGTVTDAINTVAVPDARENEVFVGTDAGEIIRSTNTGGTWTVEYSADDIVDIRFSGYRGMVMWFMNTDGDNESTLYRDLSGGACGNDIEAIASPIAVQLNAFAPRDNNYAVTVGEVVNTNGVIGIVKP
ncbi:hypothetical protein HC928_03785 [bacterium]|nr:hypothetical protein [bacterium]